jgi:hypothetical protein
LVDEILKVQFGVENYFVLNIIGINNNYVKKENVGKACRDMECESYCNARKLKGLIALMEHTHIHTYIHAHMHTGTHMHTLAQSFHFP